MGRKGRGGASPKSRKDNVQAASSSKQESPSSKRAKKPENSGSREPQSKKKAIVQDGKKTEDRKDRSVGRGQSNSRPSTSTRTPTNEHPLKNVQSEKPESAQLLGVQHSRGGDKSKRQQLYKGSTACNSSSSSCKKCTAFNDDQGAFKRNGREVVITKTKSQEEENQAKKGFKGGQLQESSGFRGSQLQESSSFRGGQLQESSTARHPIRGPRSLDEGDSESEINGYHGQGGITANVEQDSVMDIKYPPAASSDVYMVDATNEDSDELHGKGVEDEPRVTREEASLVHHLDKGKTEERKSIGDEYNVMQYARSEWKSDTATATAVREVRCRLQ